MAMPSTDARPAVPRPLVLIVGLAGALIVVIGLRNLSEIIGPSFLALVLTVAAHPLGPWAARKGLPRWVGTTVAILLIYASLIGLAVALLVAGARFATLLPTYQAQFDKLLQDGLAWLESAGVGKRQIEELTGAFDMGKIVGALGDLATGLLGVASSLVFILTLVIFMVVDATGFP